MICSTILMKPSRQDETLQPGQLASVPRFQELLHLVNDGPARHCYSDVHRTTTDLGRAVQLGQHRRLIDSLAARLSLITLIAITAECLRNPVFCSALSVYFTTLEQAYHWPRDDASISTPSSLEDHKLVIQVLHQPELRTLLETRMNVSLHHDPNPQVVAQASLAMARWMLHETDFGTSPQNKQDLVNRLYRTCRGDWFDQGSYLDTSSHLEFSRLHEAVRTNGTQRRVQELFEETGGLARLQRMPDLLRSLPASAPEICSALVNLQVSVIRANDELFGMMIDETIWGCTFARFSKAVGVCTVSAGGADCPMFRMLDALCGRADPTAQAMLLEELDFRSRFFPPNMRALIDNVASAPSIRQHVADRDDALSAAFSALQRALWSLYEMHRKKGLRIILALRAGQARTSSGTQKAASPEKHIGGILSETMRVRFGNDPGGLSTLAHGTSEPLMFGLDGKVEVAHVRFLLGTPLVIFPGDTVRVSVQMKPGGGWKTRTYSVMRTESTPGNAVGMGSAVEMATAVEVCVRRQGPVSSYLCSQHKGDGFAARVAVMPAPHFRIEGNVAVDEETIFVAQGAAAGLFIAWLARHQQHELVGRYRLVVGARSWSQLPHAGQLLDLLIDSQTQHGQGKNSLQIAVSLSAPGPADIAILSMVGIQAHAGRVTEYLRHLDTSEGPIRAIYVCGSAAFGVDAARCISTRVLDKSRVIVTDEPHGPRLRPIITSRLPTLRLHVSSGPTQPSITRTPTSASKRVISRAELAQHNTPDSLWIAVHNKVYDITPVIKFHPGGEKLLTYRAGRQAGDVFNLVHGDSHEVSAMLAEMETGTLAPAATDTAVAVWEERLDRIVEIQNDLTNNSRFEQVPTGAAEQLPYAPPVDVIRRSFHTFFASWMDFLAELTTSTASRTEVLGRALEQVKIVFDEYQARIYTEEFDRVDLCAVALRDIFEAHLASVSRIHAEIDGVKREVLCCIESGMAPDEEVLRKTAARFTRVLEEMARSFRE
ncbi:cytochrome b5-like Heme/Steroid binding domain-containing protein [Apodospora peruviana]|uniref:Cytochrome b5-like Heme/Steroid binding domain-containing protein n=1 Tax=Apodospora peruviana TaxID=516989 RepID=A0AAE0HVD7_9PEZI|nr:cytochrome b5-like Heme/Steroid binding domain-containing protein [Apodospora peruviana]